MTPAPSSDPSLGLLGGVPVNPHSLRQCSVTDVCLCIYVLAFQLNRELLEGLEEYPLLPYVCYE